MSRETAIKILSAGFGQLIAVYKRRQYERVFYAVSRLIPSGDWKYKEIEIAERESYFELVKACFPDFEAFYDDKFDIIEPSYLTRLGNARRGRIAG